MNRSRKILSLFLVITIIGSLLCVSGVQASDDPYAQLKEGTGYVAIGDSFARGYGASDHWQAQLYENEYYGHYECRNVDGSYPNLVAEAFGLNAPNDIRDMSSQFWPLTHDAVSTAFVLDLLGVDDGFRDEELTYSTPLISNRYQTDLAYFGDPLSMNFEGTGTYGKTGEIMSFRKMLEDASLITVGLGQTDVIYRTLLLGLYNADFSDASKIPSLVADIGKMLLENFERWKGIFPIFLDYLKKSNPDAKVVLVGTMNPLQNAMLSEDISIPIGSVVNPVVDMVNVVIKESAKKYGYMFVDISNVETIPLKKDLPLGEMLAAGADSVEFALMIHPDPAGYEQIARMIVSAVKESLAKDEGKASEVPSTYVRVDMGSFTDIRFVAFNYKMIKNYTFTDHVLTIPCGTTKARNLTVITKNEDGTYSLLTYHLKYDNGYSVRRMYISNNIFSPVVALFKAFISMFTDAFKNLFQPA